MGDEDPTGRRAAKPEHHSKGALRAPTTDPVPTGVRAPQQETRPGAAREAVAPDSIRFLYTQVLSACGLASDRRRAAYSDLMRPSGQGIKRSFEHCASSTEQLPNTGGGHLNPERQSILFEIGRTKYKRQKEARKS